MKLRKLTILVIVAAFLLSSNLFYSGLNTPNVIFAQTEGRLQGKKIYLGLGNRETSIFDRNAVGASRLGSLLLREEAELAIITWDVPLPSDIDLVILLAPITDYTSSQMTKLWTYITSGGSLIVAAEPGGGIKSTSAITDLLWGTFGIGIRDGILLDTTQIIQKRTAVLDAQNTPMPTATLSNEENQQFPDLITNIQAISNHPILENIALESLILRGACPLVTETLLITDASVYPLLITTDTFYGESDVAGFLGTRTSSFEIATDRAQGPQIIAAVAENETTGSRIAVLCDNDLFRNDYGFSTSPPGSDRFLYPGSVSLVLNSIYWLLEEESPQIEFNPPAPTQTPTLPPTPTLTPSPTTSTGS